MLRTLGIVLIVVGLGVLLYGGIGFTTKEKVVDLGPIEISKEKKHSLPAAPLAGAAALLAGGAMIALAKR